MKKAMIKKVRSGLSVLLAAVMAFGTPCSALANEISAEEKGALIMDAISKKDCTSLEEMIEVLEQYGPEAYEEMIKYAEENECFDKLVAYAKEVLKYAEEHKEEFVECAKPQIEAAIKELEAQLEVLEGELAAKKLELIQKIAELNAMLEEKKAQFENASEEVKAEIEAAIKEIEAVIETLEQTIAEIEAKIAEVKQAIVELNAKIEAIAAKIEALVEAAIELNATVEELIGIANGTIEGTIEDATAKVQAAAAKVAAVIEDAENLINAINTKVEEVVEFIESIPGAIEAIEEAFDAAVEDAKEALANAVEDLKAGIKEAVDAAAEDAKEALTDAVNALIADLETKVEETLDAIDAAIEAKVTDMVNDAVETLKETANALNDQVITLMGEAADQAKAILEEVIADATTDEYEVSADSYYVAIGDRSTYAFGLEKGTDGYVERFAEALGLSEEQYNNLCEECDCTSVGGCLEEIPEHAAEIAKADLVTVGFTNNSYLAFALKQFTDGYFNKEVVNPDWSALLPEEAVAHIEEKLTEFNQSFLENGMDQKTADAMTLAIESYAYSYVEYAVELPKLVGAIHEINPEATVIIVGMYNPLKGSVIFGGNMEIAFGEYIDSIIELSDMYGTAYAVLAENTIFVSAPEVETIELASETDITKLALKYTLKEGASFHANEAGHEYIKDQLLGALDITVVEEPEVPEQPEVLLGDVNCDGKVNAADVNMLFRAVNGTLTTELSEQALLNADVNGDGKINAADVNKLFRYVNGTIESLS